jgi:hypothetical protein
VSPNNASFEMEKRLMRVPTMPTGPATRWALYVSLAILTNCNSQFYNFIHEVVSTVFVSMLILVGADV